MHYARRWRRGTTDLREDLVCARCGSEFKRPYKSDPDAVRFCSHECRYADQLQTSREDPDRLAKMRAWRERNPDQFKVHLLKRKANKRGNQTALITARDLRRLIQRFDGKCAYCAVREHEISTTSFRWYAVVVIRSGICCQLAALAIWQRAPSCLPTGGFGSRSRSAFVRKRIA